MGAIPILSTASQHARPATLSREPGVTDRVASYERNIPKVPAGSVPGWLAPHVVNCQ